MSRPDALMYSAAFYSYLVAFILYILLIALKKDVLGKIATGLTALGAIPHTIAFFTRWATQGHIPLANMYEYMGLMSWMVIIGLLYFVYRYKNHRIGVFVSPIAVMMLVVASLLPSEINRQLMPALQSTWLTIHVILAAFGSGAFLISFAASALYLLTEDNEKALGDKKHQQRIWAQFLVLWVGLPILVAVIANLVGIVPESIHHLSPSQMARLSGSMITSFSLIIGGTTKYWGGAAIGLGIGLVASAITWPFVYKKSSKGFEATAGARMFLVLVVALLLSAILVGFMIRSNMLAVTPRSYFKIFEFFGPALVLSWVLTPLVYALLARSNGTWITKLGLSRSVFEELSYSAVAIGYPLYTVGALFAGAIWAEQAWGTWWSWDPKEVGALVIWLFYTGFLHARYQRQWKGTRAQVLVVLGMVFVFVSFFGNYFFGGLHSFEVAG